MSDSVTSFEQALHVLLGVVAPETLAGRQKIDVAAWLQCVEQQIDGAKVVSRLE